MNRQNQVRRSPGAHATLRRAADRHRARTPTVTAAQRALGAAEVDDL